MFSKEVLAVREIHPGELQVFLEEFRENLETMEDLVIHLEKRGQDPEVLGALFRHAHTLKGSSGTLGFRAMADLTHRMEDVLDKARSGVRELDHDAVSVLLEGIDCLRDLEAELEKGHFSDEVPLSVLEVIGRLDVFASGVSAMESALGALEVDLELLEEAWREGLSAWELEVAVDQRSGMPSVRCFQVLMSLGQVGEVAHSVPSLDEIEGDGTFDSLRVLVVSGEPEERIRKAVSSIDEVQVEGLRKVTIDDNHAPTRTAKPEAEGNTKSHFRTVRVGVDVLDNLMNLVGELVIDRSRLHEVQMRLEAGAGDGDSLRELSLTAGHLGRIATELQEEIMRARMLSVEVLFRKFPRMMRDLAAGFGKEVDLVMEGQDTELDRSMLEEISDPLVHILRNAVDHGIETPEERSAEGKPRAGLVKVWAEHKEEHVVIAIEDDGRGLDRQKILQSAIKKGIVSEDAASNLGDAETFGLIFQPGFSTATRVTEVSGRGVGLDVVKRNLERLNGTVEVAGFPGKGTRFTLRLPLTLAIIRALLVRLGEETYAIPISTVIETQNLGRDAIRTIRGHEVVDVRGRVTPLFRLANLLGQEGSEVSSDPFIVVVWVGGQTAALLVDALDGEQEVVIKTLGHPVKSCVGISGATILGQGRVALILDVVSLLETEILGCEAPRAHAV